MAEQLSEGTVFQFKDGKYRFVLWEDGIVAGDPDDVIEKIEPDTEAKLLARFCLHLLKRVTKLEKAFFDLNGTVLP